VFEEDVRFIPPLRPETFDPLHKARLGIAFAPQTQVAPVGGAY
jgi:hypothetical protein